MDYCITSQGNEDIGKLAFKYMCNNNDLMVAIYEGLACSGSPYTYGTLHEIDAVTKETLGIDPDLQFVCNTHHSDGTCNIVKVGVQIVDTYYGEYVSIDSSLVIDKCINFYTHHQRYSKLIKCDDTSITHVLYKGNDCMNSQFINETVFKTGLTTMGTTNINTKVSGCNQIFTQNSKSTTSILSRNVNQIVTPKSKSSTSVLSSNGNSSDDGNDGAYYFVAFFVIIAIILVKRCLRRAIRDACRKPKTIVAAHETESILSADESDVEDSKNSENTAIKITNTV